MSPHVLEMTELPHDPLGASGQKRIFRVEFLGKSNNSEFPYTVANEIVAMHLGVALGLNVPTVLTHHVGADDCVLVQMVDRDERMQQGPPATAAALAEYVATHLFEVHGAIVFDLFVANNDRALGPVRRNLFLDASGKLLLFDHGNCCFYRHRPGAQIAAGIPRLDAVEADLHALFDMDHKQNYYRDLLTDWKMVQIWCDRIRLLPDFLIESAIARIPVHSANDAERDRLMAFLQKRRQNLYDQMIQCQDLFPGLPQSKD